MRYGFFWLPMTWLQRSPYWSRRNRINSNAFVYSLLSKCLRKSYDRSLSACIIKKLRGRLVCLDRCGIYYCRSLWHMGQGILAKPEHGIDVYFEGFIELFR